MEEKKNVLGYEDVLNSEMNDIWDIFFPYLASEEEIVQKKEKNERRRTHNYMRFLTM